MTRPLRTFLACMLRVGTDLSSSSRTCFLCPYTCSAPVRNQSTGVKTRSYLQYVKRRILAPKAPPYSHVCQVGDPVLRCRAADVEPAAVQGAEVQRVISTMVTVMRRLKCVGLSAPQLGVPLRIIAVEYSDKLLQENPPAVIEAHGLVVVPLKVFINPQLRVLNGQTVSFQEACESISGFSASVPRYTSVEVSGSSDEEDRARTEEDGLNEKAETVSWQVSGWPARILQHEMDHLNGILYVDRMDSKTFINVNWEEYNE